MSCFITGAAGLIGSHLAEELRAAGHDVTGLDDPSAGRRVITRTGPATSITRSSRLAYGAGGGDLERRVPDGTLAADLAGFAAPRGLDEIIRAVAAEQSAARQAAA